MSISFNNLMAFFTVKFPAPWTHTTFPCLQICTQPMDQQNPGTFPPKLMTTPPLSPQQPPPPPPWTHKKFIPQSNQTHIKIRIQGNKQSIKLRKRNKIYFERFRISEAFLSSISSSINSVASLALITATKAQIATTASARSGLGFGHCWTRWWPTMAYATQSQRDVGDGETDAKRERDMGDGCINFYNYSPYKACVLYFDAII